MIRFMYIHNGIIPNKMSLVYPNVLQYNGRFIIEIDNRIFFQDDYFAICEFIMYIDKWEYEKERDMYYNCMDTVDNPLITFSFSEGVGWRIKSKWQNFECTETFQKEEILEEVKKIKKMLKIL